MALLKNRIALLILRMGLGLFLLLWACDKVAEPDAAVKIFDVFYNLRVAFSLAYVAAAFEAAVAVLIIIGAWKRYTYAIGLALHALSTVSTWRQLADPFEQGHHLFLAAIPVLAAFSALYLLRDDDVLWTLDDFRNRPTDV